MTATLRSPLLWLLVGALAVATAVGLWSIPAESELPVHWGLDGNPDRFWTRNWALSIAPLAVITTLAVCLFIGVMGPEEEVTAGRHVSHAVILGLAALFVAIQATIVLIGLGAEVPMTRVLALCLGLFSIVLGNVLPKSQPNGYAGIRLSWTLASPGNWSAAHRLTGRLMMVAGIGLAVLAVATPHPTVLALATIAAMLVPPVVGAIFSYRMARRPRAE